MTKYVEVYVEEKDAELIANLKKDQRNVHTFIDELVAHIVHQNVILEEINRENNDTIEIANNIKHHIDNKPGTLFIEEDGLI